MLPLSTKDHCQGGLCGLQILAGLDLQVSGTHLGCLGHTLVEALGMV